jgi:hypothetical protein
MENKYLKLICRATYVVDENGYMTKLDSRFPEKRLAIAKQLLTPTTLKEKNHTGVKKVENNVQIL